MFVTMQNGTKVHADSSGLWHQEIRFSELVSDASSNGLIGNRRIESIKVLGKLKTLAKEAVPVLESIINSKIYEIPSVLDAVREALVLISPEKYVMDSGVFKKVSDVKVITQNKVDIIQSPFDKFEGIEVSKKCSFCEKEAIIHPGNQGILDKLCQNNRFFCNFCLRNNYHTKDNRNILMLTFRSIIGYFYYEFYQFPKQTLMYLSEIQDYIDLHKEIGLLNPVFNYDPESCVWFIDFRRVGETKKKINIKEVYSTIVDILASFNLISNVKGIQVSKMYAKYQEAIKDFYEKRYRPDGKKICIPTLKGCGFVEWGNSTIYVQGQPVQNQKMNIEETRNFMPFMIDPEKYCQKMAQI